MKVLTIISLLLLLLNVVLGVISHNFPAVMGWYLALFNYCMILKLIYD